MDDFSKNDIQIFPDKKIKVFSHWELVGGSLSKEIEAAAVVQDKENFERALMETNCCITVKNRAIADIVVDGKAYYDDISVVALFIPAMITGFTLGVIPSWATINSHVEADVKTKNSSGNYEVNKSMVMVSWLPMALLMPFRKNPLKMEQELYENKYRSLILEMKNGGVFNET